MAVLPRNVLLLTSASAALLLGASATVLAQTPAPEPQARSGRISPVDPRLVSPPSPMAVPAPAAPARPVTMTDFVEGARLCMNAVSLQFDVRPRVLTDAGWAFSAPRQITFLGRPYRMVQYDKGNRSIALMDDGTQVVCRLIAAVEDLTQISQVRAALIAGLGAVQVDQVPGLEALAAGIRGHAPEANLANVLVVGGYSVELGADQRNLGTPPRPYRVILVTSVPLPPQFQSSALTRAGQ